jgi:ribonuclease P protein component
LKRESSRDKKKAKKKGSPELIKILESGKRRQKDIFAIYWNAAADERKSSKLFLGVSKRTLSKAHERNRAKRIIREIYREWLRKQKKKYIIMIRIVKTPDELKTPYFKQSLEPLLGKIS